MAISGEPPSPLPPRECGGGLVKRQSAASHPAMERAQAVGKTKDIREAVQAELGFDPLVDPTDIAVRDINGDVALNGTVPSYPQYLTDIAVRNINGDVALN